MAEYNVIVEEHYAHRFEIEADSEEEALEIAEELAVDACWGRGVALDCQRRVYVEKEG